ncbi:MULTISPECIES: phospholipid N-methyltransferase PmtA [Chelativorans]|jgi:phosphatidylethanolamine/phosphatidyl-N-methylethanolamine N-methyltransferase|uniref:Ribosomal RNA adenine methylase transferase n=1 Tax=Chelativorans sp. (strain BNC1) TaxID=266779 RepID=Q11KJ4_CHESB|nr:MULTISPECIES: class I SAM-dependent methyltransferase [Chelativorans]
MGRPFDVRKAIVSRFDEELRFFRGWIDKPKAVGSIVPTSGITARRMASIVRPEREDLVLELGPGTGVITRSILERGVKPENLVSVEYSLDFVEKLRDDFPRVNIVHGDAFDLDATLAPWKGRVFDSVVSAIPLLNFPVGKRIELIERLLDLLPSGRPIVQITYGALSPVPAGRGSYSVERFDFVIRNIPPAHLWIYRRHARA